MENVQNMENPVGSAPRADRDEAVGGDPRAPREGWRKVRLGEIADFIQTGPFGSQLHQYDYSEIGTPVVMPKDLIDGGVSESSIARVGDDHVVRLSRHQIKPGDFLFSRRGDVGRCALVREKESGWLCGTGCLRVGINRDLADSCFLLYCFSQHDVVSWLEGHAVGATMPNINPSILSELPFSLPPLPIQQRIAEILGAYDDAIENNRRRIALLEKMARELYRERFVRRPGRLQQNRLGNLIEVCYGKDHKALADGKIPVYGSGGIMRYVDRALYSGEAVLIPRKGTLNNIMYVNGDFWTVDTMFYAKPKVEDVAPFVYYFLSSIDMSLLNSGTAVPSMTTEVLNSMPVGVPSSEELKSFSETFMLMYDEKVALALQNRNLTRQRDRLLPRLMSGRLGVGESWAKRVVFKGGA